MESENITSIEQLNAIIQSKAACAIYFSQPDCGVCHVLEPKLSELFNERFSDIPFYSINAAEYPELSAQSSVFTVPTLLVFFEHSEMLRESRYMSVPSIADQLARPYKLMFG